MRLKKTIIRELFLSCIIKHYSVYSTLALSVLLASIFKKTDNTRTKLPNRLTVTQAISIESIRF